jgi:hypothetical protein
VPALSGYVVSDIPQTQFATLGDDRIAYQVFGQGDVDLIFASAMGDCIDLSDVHLALLVHDEPANNRFDERAVDLDHFALRVRDRRALEEWAENLDRMGCPIQASRRKSGGPLLPLRIRTTFRLSCGGSILVP